MRENLAKKNFVGCV